MTDPYMTVTRNKIKIILFSLIVFLLFIVIFEIVLRTTHLFNVSISCSEPDDLIGWRNSPNCEFWFKKENDHPITIKFNNYGYRDEDWLLEKPKDTYRIAMIGDSFIEALQVELKHTFFTLTENQLNKNHSNSVELMNFGRSGSTQTEELLVLKNEVAQFSPDMVILFFFPGNDIKEVSRKTNIAYLRPYYQISKNNDLFLENSFIKSRTFKIKSFINMFKQHSALISLLAKRYNSYMQTKLQSKLNDKETDSGSDGLENYLTLCTATQDKTYLDNYKLNKILIKTIAEYCKEKGIKFMLITLDTQAYVKELEEEYILTDPTFNPYFFEDDLKDLANSINIDYLGIQRIFRKYNEETGAILHWGNWGHWNYEGHTVVTLALTRKLESLIYSE
jgi:hypothetical protein